MLFITSHTLLREQGLKADIARPISPGSMMALFAENLKRYIAGQNLLNLVDVEAGY